MTGALLALTILAAAPGGDALDARLRAASAGAEALQGPLDGGWRLADAHGRVLREVEILDPPSAPARPSGAWRDSAGGTGFVEIVRAPDGRPRLSFAGERETIGLAPEGGGAWRGVWRGVPVTLSRRLASGRPPV